MKLFIQISKKILIIKLLIITLSLFGSFQGHATNLNGASWSTDYGDVVTLHLLTKYSELVHKKV